MSKDKKMKGLTKGLIAAVVVVAIGVLGYFGANGELFQGRSFKVASPSPTVQKVTTDIVKYEVQPLADTFAFQVSQANSAPLMTGDTDVELVTMKVSNNSRREARYVDKVTVFENGGGLSNYKLLVNGVVLSDASVVLGTAPLGGNLNSLYRTITFQLNNPIQISQNSSATFSLRADVVGGSSSVSHAIGSIVTDKGVQTNANMTFVGKDIL